MYREESNSDGEDSISSGDLKSKSSDSNVMGEDGLEDVEEDFLIEENEEENEEAFTEIVRQYTATNKDIEEQAKRMEKLICQENMKKPFFTNPLKKVVSKQKKRFEGEGFSLDLSYVTENIIAMGFPSQGFEKLYRNSAKDIINFLEKRHKDHYKVYNLCAEKNRQYSPSLFHFRISNYPFYDHNAPEFPIIFTCCEDIHSYLTAHPKNVVAIHCKAGKGRTGVIISCYLVFCGMFQSAYEALKYYGLMRTKNGKGVTIPSQIRYVNYFEYCLKKKIEVKKLTNPMLNQRKIIIYNCPIGVRPTFTIKSDGDKKQKEYIFDSSIPGNVETSIMDNGVKMILELKKDCFLSKDFLTEFRFKKKKAVFHYWLNSNFIDPSGISYIEKAMLDKVCYDKDCKIVDNNFRLEVHFDFVLEAKPPESSNFKTAQPPKKEFT